MAEVTVNGSVQVVEVAADEYVIDVGTASATVISAGAQGPPGADGEPGPPGTGVTYNTRTVTTNYTVTTADDVVLGDATAGPITLNLPPANTVGKLHFLKKIDATANTVTVRPTAGVKIDFGDEVILYRRAEVIGLVSDGSNWWGLVASAGFVPA